ncbi:hypothetical protein BDV96DRAFT_607712 [Lophiotrema nucula]|uniref:Uncharacterized protein n=1 Tax=Lophiotrema nucula TaxID=690887 RepID=A0A6A5YG07_9PLEO|nr:hypothetical protein BDV96DRAFT_607712 [Lophiotrema nucula]
MEKAASAKHGSNFEDSSSQARGDTDESVASGPQNHPDTNVDALIKRLEHIAFVESHEDPAADPADVSGSAVATSSAMTPPTMTTSANMAFAPIDSISLALPLPDVPPNTPVILPMSMTDEPAPPRAMLLSPVRYEPPGYQQAAYYSMISLSRMPAHLDKLWAQKLPRHRRVGSV